MFFFYQSLLSWFLMKWSIIFGSPSGPNLAIRNAKMDLLSTNCQYHFSILKHVSKKYTTEFLMN